MRRYRLALFGCGNVGRAFARHLQERRERVRARFDVDLALAALIDRSGACFERDGFAPTDLAALLQAKEQGRPLATSPKAQPAPRADAFGLRERAIDGVVLALPTNLDGGEPGLSLARAAFADGLDVILADKGPPLFALPELEALAARAGRLLGTSATTGSALPSLAVLRGWIGGGTLAEIAGILNGTSNLILTRLREPGRSYASALLEAQRDGIAEPDPRLDVEGFDTAIKLVILARGLIDPAVTLASVERRGITDLPEELLAQSRSGPARLRLIGRAWRDSGRTRIVVAPELVRPDDPDRGPFHAIDGASKAIRFRGDDLGEMMLVGGASSRTGTAWALLRDLIAAARAAESSEDRGPRGIREA